MDGTSKKVVIVLSFIGIIVLSIILIRSGKTTQSSGTGTGGTPQSSGTGTDGTPRSSRTGTDETPQSSGTGTDETPQSSGTGTDETPRSSRTGTDGTIPINNCVLTPWVIGECDEETGKQQALRSGTGNCAGIKMSKYEDCCETTPWVNPTGCVEGQRKFTRTIKNCPREYKTVKYESCKTIGKWYGGECGKDGKRYFSRFNWNAPELPTKKVEDCCYTSDWKLNDAKCGDDAMGNFTRTIGSKCEDNTPTTKRDKCCKVFGWTPKGTCTNGKQIYTRVVKNNDLCPSTGYKTSMVQDCCNIGGWKKSGECKAGIQIYVRSVNGYCPEKPETKKLDACCTPGKWLGTGNCDGEYEEQYRSLSKGCSSDVPKTQKVITTFCKDVEAARKLKEKKRLDDTEKARLAASERERLKALAIKQQKAKEALELEERKKRNLVKAAEDAQKKAQECSDKSWNGTNLSYNDYHKYITNDSRFAANNTEHGNIKIDVTVGKRCLGRYRGGRCSGRTIDDYSTTKTVISFNTYDHRGNSLGYRPVKTYEGRLIMYKGKLILVKYTTPNPRGPKKYELIAKFQKVDKHAVVLVSARGRKNRVLFIKNDGTRSYDLVDGKWIDHPYAKC